MDQAVALVNACAARLCRRQKERSKSEPVPIPREKGFQRSERMLTFPACQKPDGRIQVLRRKHCWHKGRHVVSGAKVAATAHGTCIYLVRSA